jgi:hypothetical protein
MHRPAACVLVGSLVVVACGSRTDLVGSPADTKDAGTVTDATARSAPDPAATVDADAMPEGGSTEDVPGAAACHLAQSVTALQTLGCIVALPPQNHCGPSEYAVGCGLLGNMGIFTAPDGCYHPSPYPTNNSGAIDLCCPCLAADAR